MQHTPFAPDRPDTEPSPDGSFSDGALPKHLRDQFSHATHDLVGEQIGGVEGYHGARQTVAGHLHVPQRAARINLPLGATVPATSYAPSSDVHHVTSGSVHINPKEVARGAATAFAGGGAVGATAAAGTMLTLGGTESLGLAAAAALPIAWNGAVAAGSTYLGGVVHNMVWQRPGSKKPGFWGTLARGMISPVSVPAGIVWNLVRKGK
jgi:hypothetical protein